MLKVKYIIPTDYYSQEKFIYICPHCGKEGYFFLHVPVNCRSCFKDIPNIKKMTSKAEHRIGHYFGKETK